MSLFSKLNQIKDLRQQAKELQNQLAGESVTVEKSGITMSMDGNQKITGLNISPELLIADKKTLVEETIIKLHAEANGKIQKIMVEKMKASGNFNLPGLS